MDAHLTAIFRSVVAEQLAVSVATVKLLIAPRIGLRLQQLTVTTGETNAAPTCPFAKRL